MQQIINLESLGTLERESYTLENKGAAQFCNLIYKFYEIKEAAIQKDFPANLPAFCTAQFSAKKSLLYDSFCFLINDILLFIHILLYIELRATLTPVHSERPPLPPWLLP